MSVIDPTAPDITPETEAEWETRRQFRDELLDGLEDRLRSAEHAIEGGPEDGVKVVTHKAWQEIFLDTHGKPIPAIDRHYAEVQTGASVTVWAKCPRCGIPAPILLLIDPELRVDTSGAELRLKAKAKPRTHMCGQLTIPAPSPEVEGQEELNLDGLATPPDPCPFPDCELAAEHEGDHHIVVIGMDLDDPDDLEPDHEP